MRNTPQKSRLHVTSAQVSAVLRPFPGAAIGSVVVLLVSFCAYHQHFNLSAAASLDILIVLLVALWFGFWQATATSFAAVACLGYFFAPPILSFYVADPHNWVALAVFELTALIGSQLSTQAAACRRIVVKSREMDCNACSRSAADYPAMVNAPPQDKARLYALAAETTKP
jgi:K+-sensing histidine kinase KdpD